MAITTKIKDALNVFLEHLNLRIDSRTKIEAERRRVEAMEAVGRLSKPVYPLTSGMRRFNPAPVVAAYDQYKNDIERMKGPRTNKTGYDLDNPFYSSPDCDVLYLMVRSIKPRRVVEIGCGNSTRIIREAIIDGGLETELVSIDPSPRAEITGLSDRFFQKRLEEIENFSESLGLMKDDILFIDSSHEVFVGNDVAEIFCRIIPSLPSGVVIHVHDVFLPYEYPPSFAKDYSQWGEQYLVHALCYAGDHDVLWPGYHLQCDWLDLHEQLPFLKKGRAQSFWFRSQ